MPTTDQPSFYKIASDGWKRFEVSAYVEGSERPEDGAANFNFFLRVSPSIDGDIRTLLFSMPLPGLPTFKRLLLPNATLFTAAFDDTKGHMNFGKLEAYLHSNLHAFAVSLNDINTGEYFHK